MRDGEEKLDASEGYSESYVGDGAVRHPNYSKARLFESNCQRKEKGNRRQQFHADKPNQIWVSDVTYFKLKQNHFYVCVIIDLFSRKVILYKISKKNSTQLITSTFKIACETRQPNPRLIFHSDRGSQYTSHRLQQLLHEHGMI